MRNIMPAVIAVLILAAASPSAADCGWVLWREQFLSSGASTWSIEAGAPDFKACSATVQQQIDGFLKSNPRYRLFPDRQNWLNRFDEQTKTWVAFDGHRYICLPDTISDPRRKEQQK